MKSRFIPLLGAAFLASATLPAQAEPITVNNPLEVPVGIRGAVELTFQSVIGTFYQVEISQDLTNWDNEGFAIKGTGGEITTQVSTRNYSPSAFYRLRDDGDPDNVGPAGESGLRSTGENLLFTNSNQAFAWHHDDGQFYDQSLSGTLLATAESDGNFAVLTSTVVYTWNQDTKDWTSRGITGSNPVVIGSEGNFAFVSSTLLIAWCKDDSSFTTQGISSSTPELFESQGNFCVIAGNLAYAWSQIGKTWVFQSITGTDPTVVGSNGNFGVLTSSRAYGWSQESQTWSNRSGFTASSEVLGADETP